MAAPGPRRSADPILDLYDFAGIHAGLRKGAAEQPDVLDQAILRVEQQRDKDLVLEFRELGAQVVAYDLR